jgi:RNA polymerase sigma-70 factor (ECF subfamily)
VSWQQPLPFGVTSAGPFRYTGSFIANSVTMRIGARLPIRNVALAAGTGIGASLIDFNSTTVDASSTEIVGIEVGALKSRLHRARMALRTQLAGVVGASGGEACPELAQELTAYAASEIDQATCEKIEQHLAGCPRCTGACDALKRTVSLCKSIGDAVPAPVRTAVRGAIRDAIGH